MWDLDAAWGWNFGLMAMMAARLGRRDAVSILVINNASKNGHLQCGCNSPPHCYLPGNGALLATVNMVAYLDAHMLVLMRNGRGGTVPGMR